MGNVPALFFGNFPWEVQAVVLVARFPSPPGVRGTRGHFFVSFCGPSGDIADGVRAK